MLRVTTAILTTISCLSVTGLASTFCERTIDMIGKTRGETCQFWFSEHMFGECLLDLTYIVLLGPDNADLFSCKTSLADSSLFKSQLDAVGAEPYRALTDSSGIWRISESTYFELPPSDSTFRARFLEYGGVLESWNRNCIAGCSDYPVFHGARARLLFRHGSGLYKNYMVRSAIYYEDSRWLVMITDQPLTSSDATMHGLLIFNVTPEDPGTVDTLTGVWSLPSGNVRSPEGPKAGAICDQSLVLFDKTVGDHALMFFREDWEGRGCPFKSFHTLFLLPDRVHEFISNSVQGNWIPELYDNMTTEPCEYLDPVDGRFHLNDSAYFTLPSFDSAFLAMFDSLIQPDAKTWRALCPNENCTDYPIFAKVCPELIYELPDGLYKNYTVAEARYYRASNYLVITTRQPLRDCRGRSMHGLMIFKVDGWQWLDQPPCGQVK